jgi:hypothetical protein
MLDSGFSASALSSTLVHRFSLLQLFLFHFASEGIQGSQKNSPFIVLHLQAESFEIILIQF